MGRADRRAFGWDREALAEFLSDRVDVHVYALGDLDEPYWSASAWWRRGDALLGIVQLPDGEGVACYGVSTRAPAATCALIAEAAVHLPVGQLITGPVGLGAALADVRPVRWARRHQRYVLTDFDRVDSSPPKMRQNQGIWPDRGDARM
jgi:hypothetical protein